MRGYDSMAMGAAAVFALSAGKAGGEARMCIFGGRHANHERTALTGKNTPNYGRRDEGRKGQMRPQVLTQVRVRWQRRPAPINRTWYRIRPVEKEWNLMHRLDEGSPIFGVVISQNEPGTMTVRPLSLPVAPAREAHRPHNRQVIISATHWAYLSRQKKINTQNLGTGQ